MNTLNKKILIIGMGRFGVALAKILKEDFEVYVWNRSEKKDLAQQIGVNWIDLKGGIKACDVIFYCVPISKFEQIFKSHLKFYKNSDPKLFIDIQSVKISPKKVLEKYLPKHCQALLTHPIFGPDSIKTNSLKNLRIMMDQFTASQENYQFWKKYFLSKELKVIEITAEEHDRLAASSQGVVFFLGRVLENFGFKKTPVDTYWVSQLHQIVYEAVANDSWQLFVDLQTQNPYTKTMRIKLGKSFDKIYNQLLPKKLNPNKTIFGIQGGKGSFNEAALKQYVTENDIKKYEIKYLYTSYKVLSALNKGEIDYGLFAIHNSVGGTVEESVRAMADFKFHIKSEIKIVIQHTLMKHQDIDLDKITTIMTHPQVIKQCAKNLKQKYAHLNIISGQGNLIDHARIAKQLADGKIDKKIAVMGSEILAKIYNLEIIEQNLQDSDNNITSFFLVERKNLLTT